MVMGDQDVRQFPAGRFQRRLDRRRLGRVDCGGSAAFGVVQQHPVIVGSAEKQAGFRGHGLGPLGILEQVNRIMRVNVRARPRSSAPLAVCYAVSW